LKRDIIVIGASAGGIPVLEQISAALPADLQASVFVTVHVPAGRRSELPAIISHRGRLRALHPVSGQPIVPGEIYIAPPDQHLLIEAGHIELWRGPKENRHRPAINVTFRSAAINYGERVIGAVLSGVMDDGATGLWWIKRHGGLAVVQDPRDAEFPDMPCAALEHVAVDYVVGAPQLGPLLGALSREPGRAYERMPVDGNEEAH
jgi:two-component system chemotaxis response regulator CheB